jgi:tripartite-type tricarboxylate transporter receptor subunit TctC
VLGVSMTRVPYRGSAPIINDLLGGHLPFGITTIADAMPQYRAGGVKILTVSSAARSPFLPEVPTLRESGVDLVADAWYGMWLPAGGPPDFAAKLSTAVAATLNKPEVKEKLLAIGLIPEGRTALPRSWPPTPRSGSRSSRRRVTRSRIRAFSSEACPRT